VSRRARAAAILLLLAAPPASAAQEDDLAALRARIEALQAELEGKEASRRDARDGLRGAERAISEANRRLRALDAEAQSARGEARALEGRRRGLEQVLEERRAALGRLLAARRAGGAPGLLQLALSGEDPGEVARKLVYAAYLSRAGARLIASYRAALEELERLKRQALERAARLRDIERDEREERQRIFAERRERRRALDSLAGEIRRGRRQVRLLRADETALSRLVEEIGRVLAAKPGAGFARVESVPEADVRGGPFSARRGSLRLPVRGELIGRFGTPRVSGESGAKGVFIRAAEGEPVRAVAAGRVVYADWMRGLGNLLILDHGEGYLSVYANNEALLKRQGETVAGGETVATVGASGGNEETGLYFELRHLGRAFDPLRWVTLK
jgi:septal ring factor EnvC (AmiA/AmiB activator)